MRSFINIREAEARHIEALGTLYLRYGIPIPKNTWPGKIERYANVQEACEASVAAEIANGDLYDKLFAEPMRADIMIVLRNLQEASLERHLPAFQRCAQCGGGGGQGHVAVLGLGVVLEGGRDVVKAAEVSNNLAAH